METAMPLVSLMRFSTAGGDLLGLADLLDLFPNRVAGILRSSSRPLSLSLSSSSLPTSVAALDIGYGSVGHSFGFGV